MTGNLILAAGFALALSALAAPAQQASGFGAALAAVGDEEWDMAYALATPAGPVARELVTWHRLREGAGTFGDYADFLAANPDWPGLDRLRAKAEEAMEDGIAPETVVAFFDDVAPQTGPGVIRQVIALRALGRAEAADAALRDAWLGLGLNDEWQDALIAAFGAELAPHHAARADAMLWRWRTADAVRMLPLLSGDQRLLAEARIAFIRGDGDRASHFAAVPVALQSHPGLAYDRFSRLAQSGDYTDAVILLTERTGDPALLGEPYRWASWRATLARWVMREGRPQQAYDLAVAHHLTSGEFYADLEWLAGYIALTYMENPGLARDHFARVEADVTGPISAARAGYWLGRAQDALGDNAAAEAAYGRAARHQTAFYGLLAAERLGRTLDPALVGGEAVPDWREAAFMQGDLAQALRLSLAAEARGTAVLFVARLGQTLERAEIAQLGAMLAEMNEPFLTVLLGKAAAERGIVLPAIYFPRHDMLDMDLPVAAELAIAIARRESEFNHVVGSPVGALGLMQLMPATAEEVAGELGLSYSRGRLTSDWEYNATLGARYLANLQGMFGNSPVLIAAGYNAGPSRPRTWMGLRGDPRDAGVNVVDWIEHIPFTETRNYVMRVTESMPVYRAQLTGEVGEIGFLALLNGERPRIRPQARPERGGAASVPVPVVAAVGSAPLRPQIRPAERAPSN